MRVEVYTIFFEARHLIKIMKFEMTRRTLVAPVWKMILHYLEVNYIILKKLQSSAHFTKSIMK